MVGKALYFRNHVYTLNNFLSNPWLTGLELTRTHCFSKILLTKNVMYFQKTLKLHPALFQIVFLPESSV